MLKNYFSKIILNEHRRTRGAGGEHLKKYSLKFSGNKNAMNHNLRGPSGPPLINLSKNLKESPICNSNYCGVSIKTSDKIYCIGARSYSVSEKRA
jgi:hypothetical protein